MRDFYKIYFKPFLIRIYSILVNTYRSMQNLPYKKSVDRIISEDILKKKIIELDNVACSKTEKIFYVIRRDNSSIGLLTYVSVFLGHIAYAISKGYIPIIDMQNFKSIYLNDEDLGIKNAWELYFKQPYDFKFDEVIASEKCIYSPLYIQPLSPFINSVLSDKESEFWKILYKKYIKFNDSVEIYVKDEFDKLIKGKKVLGLLYRGTDYNSLRPRHHPIQPTINQFIEKVEECIIKWGDFDYYYIATEDKTAVECLEKKFPGKIIVNKREYYDGFKDITYLAQAKFDRENDNYLKGLEYLSSIYMLSQCNSFIAGLCAGTYGANFMNSTGFENKYFFYYGVY